jgi:hypothetical protein
VWDDFPQIHPYKPEGISYSQMGLIQEAHDDQVESYMKYAQHPWNHQKFVNDLLSLDCFAEFREYDEDDED